MISGRTQAQQCRCLRAELVEYTSPLCIWLQWHDVKRLAPVIADCVAHHPPEHIDVRNCYYVAWLRKLSDLPAQLGVLVSGNLESHQWDGGQRQHHHADKRSRAPIPGIVACNTCSSTKGKERQQIRGKDRYLDHWLGNHAYDDRHGQCPDWNHQCPNTTAAFQHCRRCQEKKYKQPCNPERQDRRRCPPGNKCSRYHYYGKQRG